MTEPTARERIAERVKNAYAAGHNDGRADRADSIDRMDAAADLETTRILEVVREVLSDDKPGGAVGTLAVALMDFHGYSSIESARVMAETHLRDVAVAAFGADDDGGEREHEH